jgi:hypothetical protein
MATAAAVIVMKERHIAEAFERAGATTASHGRSPAELDVDPSGIGWRRLRDRAIVRESSPGTGLYYLDLEVWQATRRTRRRALAVVLIVLLVILALTATGVSIGVSNR